MAEIDSFNIGGTLYTLPQIAQQLDPGASIDGVAFNGTTNITHYAVCPTSASVASKAAYIEGFSLVTGAKIAIKFSNADTSGAPTLNVSNTGAVAIKRYGTSDPINGAWKDNEVVSLVYDGTYWMIEGVTNAIIDIDDTLTIQGAAADAEATGVAIGELKSALENGLVSGFETLINQNYIVDIDYINAVVDSQTGKPTSNSKRATQIVPVYVTSDVLITVVTASGYSKNNNVFWYDKDGTYLGYSTYSAGMSVYSGASYFRVVVYKGNGSDDITTAEASANTTITLESQFQRNGYQNYILDNRNLLTYANRIQNKYYNGTGSYSSNTGYDIFELEISNGTTYYFPNGYRFLCKENSLIDQSKNGQFITYTADYTGKLIVTLSKEYPGWIVSTVNSNTIRPYDTPSVNSYVFKNSTGTSTKYGMTQKAITDAIANMSGSILYGKKWVACGDSFTEGDFNGLQPSDYIFPDEPYKNEKMVYPFWIGRRTGCVVVNEAKSGSTMAYIDGSRNEFSTPNGRYTQIASDADYITLYFGINDSHQNVPIGNIDDNVNTTFYGAWNIVMQYLITNHPNAKIGIIISNGCDSIDYPNAEIAIAKKYGVAYFDMNGDYKIPLVFRTNGKPDISAAILSQRNNQYYVGSGNAHPNVACHKDESTFIGAWLESI